MLKACSLGRNFLGIRVLRSTARYGVREIGSTAVEHVAGEHQLLRSVPDPGKVQKLRLRELVAQGALPVLP